MAKTLSEQTGTKRYRSDPLRSLHEVVKDLHAVGAIDKATMRDFDKRLEKRRRRAMETTEARAARIRAHYAREVALGRIAPDVATERLVRDLAGDNYRAGTPQRSGAGL